MDYREEMKQLRDFLNQQSYLYYVDRKSVV